MKKTILAVLAAIALAGCSPSAQQVNYPVMPDELKDCKVFRIRDGERHPTLYVVRCPNSTVSTEYRSGKTSVNTVTIDGVKYTRKD